MNILLIIGGISEFVSISAAQAAYGIILLILIKNVAYDRKYKITECETAVYILIYFLATVLSSIFAVDRAESFSELSDMWLMMSLFAGFFLINRDNVRYALYPLIAGAVIASLYGTYQYFTNDGLKAVAFFSHSLTYGNALAIVLCMVFAMILFRFTNSDREKLFLYVSAAVIFWGLSLGSRGPFLYGVVTLSVLFVMRFRLKGALYSFLLYFTGVIIIFFMPGLKESFMRLFSADYIDPTTSFGTRIVLWKASAASILENPVFGTGYGSFDVVREKITVKTGSQAHAHNAYLQVLVYHGFVGFTALMLIFARMAKTFVKNRPGLYSYMGLSVLIVFMLEGLSENSFADSEIELLFWFVSGICLGMSRKTDIIKG